MKSVAQRAGRAVAGLMAMALASGAAAPGAASQDLADFDYENLAFRGIGLHASYLSPTRVESTVGLGTRLDLGYLGPGLRIVPTITHWSSKMERSEVRELEDRVAELVNRETPGDAEPVTVDLGNIEWSDLVLGLDTHVVWTVPLDLLTYLGAGVAAHIQNGSGDAIRGTFVEDLLDSVTAGFNLHGGLEYPFSRSLRVYGETRYEILGDLQYLELRAGLAFMFGPSAPGEERSR